jgi:hypothetical protein
MGFQSYVQENLRIFEMKKKYCVLLSACPNFLLGKKWMDLLFPTILLLTLKKPLHTTISLHFSLDPTSPHKTLTIKEFISFKLPPLQTCIKDPSSCLSNKPPSTNILSEANVCLVHHPSQLDMKRLIAEFDVGDENPLTSVEIGSCCVPIVILEIWRVCLWLWDLQNLWKGSLRPAGSLTMQWPSQQWAINAVQWNEEI